MSFDVRHGDCSYELAVYKDGNEIARVSLAPEIIVFMNPGYEEYLLKIGEVIRVNLSEVRFPYKNLMTKFYVDGDATGKRMPGVPLPLFDRSSG